MHTRKEWDVSIIVCGGRLAEWREELFWTGGKADPFTKFWIYRKWMLFRRRMMETLTDEQAHSMYRRNALPNLIAGVV